jgi:hypothetical protein
VLLEVVDMALVRYRKKVLEVVYRLVVGVDTLLHLTMNV